MHRADEVVSDTRRNSRRILDLAWRRIAPVGTGHKYFRLHARFFKAIKQVQRLAQDQIVESYFGSEERERADAYTLTWDAARRMTEALCAEVEVPTPLAAGLIDAVAAIVDAPDVAPLIAAMRAACAAARGAASSP